MMAKVNVREKFGYKSVAISCQAKDLLEEIGKIFDEKNKDSVVKKSFNRVVFVSELIEEAYKKMKEE